MQKQVTVKDLKVKKAKSPKRKKAPRVKPKDGRASALKIFDEVEAGL